MDFCLSSKFHIFTILIPRQFAHPQRQIFSRTVIRPKFTKCLALASPNYTTLQKAIERREANYHASIWDDGYIQTLTSIYQRESSYAKRADELKGDAREMLKKEESLMYKLELIATLQRLGIYYHFETEIKQILESIYNLHATCLKEDLYAMSLKFRLLRQHGYDISQDGFKIFMDESGKFKSYLSEDTKAMLSLYEASYLSIRGEKIMDEAREFSLKHLKEYVKKNNDDHDVLKKLVTHSLELPLHWRVGRLEARWFINTYEDKQDMNPTLLQFAKLDYNMVQSVHLEDLKYLSRWWKSTKLGVNLSFARDRLMANFIWTVESCFLPESRNCRRLGTMVNSLITVIDDVYDVYGTLEELRIFTDVIERWDVNAIDQLPSYMKICCLSLFNTINQVAYDVLTEHNINIIPYLKSAWTKLCKCYLLEAEWYNNKYIPTLDEYLENAWVSISAPVILVHAYSQLMNPLTHAGFEFVESCPDLIRCASMILRLADDLGTSTAELERGDNLKSIQCYMHETGASEEKAREHIDYLISETWKEMNEYRVIRDYPFNQTFVDAALNTGRMAQCMYQHGDGHGVENLETKDRVLALLINPIPIDACM